jgi:flagellar basal-body rod protein FlgB
MALDFNSALGIHPQALVLREKRGEVLAANLANADTPDYKARDMDFKSVLANAQSRSAAVSSVQLQQTSEGHMSGINQLLGANLMYRNPQQPSLDGNTVETHIEQAKYAENAVQYQASLTFVNEDLGGLVTAIKGV